MSCKHSFFTGQPVFSQLLNLIPRSTVSQLTKKHTANRYCKSFMSWDHIVSMLYQGFFECLSLRELTLGLQANANRLKHLGLSATPRRSTIADANKRRPAAFFEDLYHTIYNRYHHTLPDSRSLYEQLFIIDSTTISLFSSIMRGAGTRGKDGRKKGGAKAHFLLDAEHNLPAYVWISEARFSDQDFLSRIQVPPGSLVVFDMGYNNFEQFIRWDTEHTTWVTRQRADSYYVIEHTNPLSDQSLKAGVLLDQCIILGRPGNQIQTPMVAARSIRFRDQESKRIFTFLTNNKELTPEQVADTYKKRWQIELVFKRIKQRYPLKYFLGQTENAIRIQIWASLLCDLLVQIVMNQVNALRKKNWSYANISSVIRQHLMTYIGLRAFLTNPEQALLAANSGVVKKGTLFD